MHIRFYLFVIFFFCLLSRGLAQEFTLRGVISKKSSTERVGQVLIKDLNAGTLMLGDDLGWFSIKIHLNDTLLFSKEGFTPQKILVLNQSDMSVHMQPMIALGEVKIVGQTKKQEINEIMKDYRRQGTFYNGDPPVLSFLTNPITGIYELFGKTPNRARRFAIYARGELEQTEVDRRYNIAFVRQYTKLPSDSLARKFMSYYTPSYEDLKQWNDYELIKHMQKTFEYYKVTKDRDRLEKLNNPTFIKSDSTLRLSDGVVIK